MPHPPIISTQSVGIRLGRAVVQRGALGFYWSEESRRKNGISGCGVPKTRRTAHRTPWEPWYATARERSADALTREPVLSAVIVSGLFGEHRLVVSKRRHRIDAGRPQGWPETGLKACY